MGRLDELDWFHAEDRPSWRAWLGDNHRAASGVWLVTWKKATGRPRIEYADIVEEALCVGWVDSQARTVDDERSRLLITPRKPRSGWSRPNKERIALLTAQDLMLAAGLAVVEAARADGSWNALDAVEALEEPQDLRAALDRDPAARTHWDAFPRSAKRAILEWISTAKRPETRTNRIEETAARAAQNVRANQWRQPG